MAGPELRSALEGDVPAWLLGEDDAREFVAAAAGAIAGLVRTTYGPAGAEKLIQTADHQGEDELVLADDASTILDAIERGDGFNHPASVVFLDSLDAMQRGLGDGTTASILLTDALLGRGLDLLDEGLHRVDVLVGFSEAATRTGAVLDDLSRECAGDDRETLERVARTSMTGTVGPRTDEHAAAVADVIARLSARSDGGFLDTDDVRVLAAADVDRTTVYDGLIVRRSPDLLEDEETWTRDFDWRPAVPEPVADATVAILDAEIDPEGTATNFTQGRSTGVTLDSREATEAYVAGLEDRLDALAARVADLGADVIVSRERLEPDVVHRFEAAGVAVIDGAETPVSDVYRLARATGGRVVSHLDDLEPDDLGTAGRVSERRVGDEKWATFEGCPGGVLSLVLRARTDSGAERAERLVTDAVRVAALAASDGQVLPGAGAPMMAAATDLRAHAPSLAGPEQLAVEAFADAVEALVGTLARNAGHDRLDAVTALRQVHAGTAGPSALGLDVGTGEPVDAWEAGIVEPRRVFSQAIETARATTADLLAIDGVAYPEVDLEDFTPEVAHD